MNEHLVVRGNFLGAAIVAIIYTAYILGRPMTMKKPLLVIILVILNALTIILMRYAFIYK